MPGWIVAAGLSTDALAVIALLVTLAAILAHTSLSSAGHARSLRPISAYRRLRRLTDEAAESGRPIHVALGAGAMGGPNTPEAVMGLTVLDYVAGRAARYGQEMLVTTGDAATLAAAQGLVQGARWQAGSASTCAAREARFSGPDALVYAAGAADAALSPEEHPLPLAHALWGHWGAEGLWLAEATHRPDVSQLGGAASPAANALLYISLDEAVLGEDLFAAGAYLHRRAHVGSLVTQDLLRLAVLVLIVAGAILSTLGLWG